MSNQDSSAADRVSGLNGLLGGPTRSERSEHGSEVGRDAADADAA